MAPSNSILDIQFTRSLPVQTSNTQSSPSREGARGRRVAALAFLLTNVDDNDTLREKENEREETRGRERRKSNDGRRGVSVVPLSGAHAASNYVERSPESPPSGNWRGRGSYLFCVAAAPTTDRWPTHAQR